MIALRSLSLPIAVSLASVILISGCSFKFKDRIAKPVDTHTQYVAADLITPACLTRCDLNQDGRIQYRLWPNTGGPEIIPEQEGKETKVEQTLEHNPDAEYQCWQQCKSGAVITGPSMTGPEGDKTMTTPAAAPADNDKLPAAP